MLMGLVMSLTMTTQANFIENMHMADLNDKKIAYFNGSFEPYHKGHEAITQTLSQQVDYVIVYANPGKRDIIPLNVDIPNISSAEIRQKIQEGEPLTHLLDPKIITLLSNKQKKNSKA